MTATPADQFARERLATLATEAGLDVRGGHIRRSSSRFCLGVEHGDYNGTDLFGVGTDRFIWAAYKPNDSGRVRLISDNFRDDGIVEFTPGATPGPGDPAFAESWARFPFGVDWVLRRAGLPTDRGLDVVVHGNIPGGGMSRSASLTLNLILTVLEVNGVEVDDGFTIVDLAQAVETDYVGSPSGQLDQIMIYFARAGRGTLYRPHDRAISYVPVGGDAPDFRLVSLDTGTVRPGLENSTYRVRRAECNECVARIRESESIECLADVRDAAMLDRIARHLSNSAPHLFDRLRYIYAAQRRFGTMVDAWRAGDIATVGAVFRADGIGLRDHYRVSGPELEAMCDIARTVSGVYGERMLGGGDKGAAGALVAAGAVPELERAVATAYPRSHPDYADLYRLHECRVVDGITTLEDGVPN